MASESLPRWLLPRAAYIHIPFCQHHCGYCDFAVTAGRDHLIDSYLDALDRELQSLEEPKKVETIFIGGGTPTYLSIRQLSRMMQIINRWLPLESDGEFSIESTPESITSEKVHLLADHGINRFSMGIQTFDYSLLKTLDRIHSPDHISKALQAVKERITNASIDFIFGIPGQTEKQWKRELEIAIELETKHISTYGLTFEKGTPIWKQLQGNQIKAVPEETELAMYELAMDFLGSKGFAHYEISNFTLPGFNSRHNETYWANDAYYGFGVGAARYVMGYRELNRRNTEDYIAKIQAGESPTFQSEKLDPIETARETAAVQLRRSRGIEFDSFRIRTGFSIEEIVEDRLQFYLDENLLQKTDKAISLTRRGRCVADGLIVAIIWGRPSSRD